MIQGIPALIASGMSKKLWQVFPTQIPAFAAGLDSDQVNLGMVFKSSKAGRVLGGMFYRQAGMGLTHYATLYDFNSQVQLAQVLYTNENTSLVGWDYRPFSSPVNISAETPYVLAIYMANSVYAVDNNSNSGPTHFDAGPYTNGPLTGFQNASADPVYSGGFNGLFRYDVGGVNGPQFPTGTFHAANYWVDVLFEY